MFTLSDVLRSHPILIALHKFFIVLACLLHIVTDRTAAMVAAWQANGFVHGVMNTDNFSILSITIDVNVYGFINNYDPSFTPNFIDDQGRYAFGQQSTIAQVHSAS